MKFRTVMVNALDTRGNEIISYKVQGFKWFKWKTLTSFKEFEKDKAIKLTKKLNQRKKIKLVTVIK
ncbi:gp5 [Escherichia phage N4]|uniref:Gp5 n=5 Tax=Enquatrovirus N4 TaxID=10752 RepID=A0MZ97_BPN4|nr:hypothetical protein EPNV4_gp05 [Escherichia phage N4]QDF14903.1 hypothetical protein AC3HA13_050 [Escherichia phage vB_EcoP_3HA13]QPN96271.1 hypothetical protein vec25_05 [Escherichia phage VEc25]CAE6410522.1 gp5 [Escherichia phage vB_Eco_Jura]CAH0462248.1 gp5 [Escherichia phage N4] [Escherichia phage vB_Eco_SPSP]CAH6421896.1 hypothetical protien [Escherichia phage vB_Eco_AL25]